GGQDLADLVAGSGDPGDGGTTVDAHELSCPESELSVIYAEQSRWWFWVRFAALRTAAHGSNGSHRLDLCSARQLHANSIPCACWIADLFPRRSDGNPDTAKQSLQHRTDLRLPCTDARGTESLRESVRQCAFESIATASGIRAATFESVAAWRWS